MNTPSISNPLDVASRPTGKINGIELTALGHACVEAIIRSLPPKSLKILWKESKGQHQDPEGFRQALLQDFRNGKDLPRPVLERLKTRLSLDGLIKSFGESFHRNAIPAWVRFFGLGQVEVAFALDGRTGATSVLAVLRRLRPGDVPNVDRALDILTESITEGLKPLDVSYALKFHGYAGKFTPNLSKDTIEEPFGEADVKPPDQAQESSAKAYLKAYSQGRADSLEEITRLQSEKKDLESRLKELKDNQEERQNTLDSLHREQLHKLTQALKESEASRLVAEQTVQQLNGRLLEVEASIETEVARGIERELSSTVRPWLEEARRLQGLSADRTDKSLTDKANALLRAQEALDMKHGSRTRLKRRLSEFEEYAVKIRSVLEDSIRPIEDLGSLLSEFESEIHRTRVILGEDRPPSPLVSKLEEAIHKASTSESLDSLADNIAALHDAGVFTHKEHLRLTKQQLKAYDRLRTRYELKVEAPQRRSGWELCQVVGSNKKAVIYLDGNNVLHRDDRYAHLFPESGKMNKDVEDALLSDVRAVAAKSPTVRFRVVFDSHTESVEEVADNVVVQRSGGSGTDRADSAIVLHLAKADHGTKRFVITDDNELRQQATKLGGVYADVAVWDVLLDALVPTATLTPCDIPA